MPSYLVSPKPPPSLNIPPSSSTVTVRIIDSTTTLRINPDIFWQPKTKGLEAVDAPVFCFLISNGSNHVIFDLGVRRDWENYAPSTVQLIKATTTVQTEKNISEILDSDTSGLAIKSTDISAIIWSHHHFDHIGDPSTFPPSTALVVGPGFKAHHWPGYPTNPSSTLLDSDLAGRPLHEISFQSSNPSTLRIGRFLAVDYFSNGSFYLLDAPGHDIGHLCGLARVTSSPDSFIFMGADACHHPGLLRPTPYLPLPSAISPSPLAKFAVAGACPGALLQQVQPRGSACQPFFEVSARAFPAGREARETVRGIEELDAQANVFVVIAHDESLLGAVDLFPETANGWMGKGWKARTRWMFCKDLAGAVE